MKILAVGELLWDVFRDHERLGGAPFNFAVHAHRLGHDAILASAVGDDDRGRRALEEVRRLGLPADYIRVIADQPTGIVTITMVDGEPDYVIHRPAAYDFLEIPEISKDFLYYGTICGSAIVGGEPACLPASAVTVTGGKNLKPAGMPARRLGSLPHRLFYDVNLRKDSYTDALVHRLFDAADIVKLNESELAYTGKSIHELRDDYNLHALALTRAERGCSILIGDDYTDAPAPQIERVDPVGAGDAFAAAFLHGLNQGWSAAKIGEFANRYAATCASIHPR